MRAPEFWYSRRKSLVSVLLLPVSWLYGLGASLRALMTQPQSINTPIICIGNLVAGGAGKTPTVLALADLLSHSGKKVAFLTRGYGGTVLGPELVDISRHFARDVGDEAILLAATAPTMVATDRLAGARALENQADIILMDDGFQNPSLVKNLSLIVIDHLQGVGNHRVIPAGPLRNSLKKQITQADGFIIIGGNLIDRQLQVMLEVSGKSVFAAQLEETDSAPRLKNMKIIAFTGIGVPDKFFTTLRRTGAEIIEEIGFPDHYQFTISDAEWLLELVNDNPGALLLTTEKDHVRLKGQAGALARLYETSVPYPVALKFEDENLILEFVSGLTR